MSFIETPRFPIQVSMGATGGPEYRTDIVQLNSGWEQRNVNWEQSRNRYQIEFPLIPQNKDALLTWFRAVKARGHGFRIRDWLDYTTTSALVSVSGTGMMGRLGTAAGGNGLPAYQLTKYYSVTSSLEEYRTIRKPSLVAVYRAGVLQTAGAGAGNYAVDLTTGIVTFVADATSAATSVTVGTSTTVVLTTNPGTLIVGQKLYLVNFGGSAAGQALVNNLAHTILSVSGTGPFTFLLDTNTLGQTVILGSGAGRRYAQAVDVLSWAGEFDVPVRFDGDYASLAKESSGFFRGDGFSLIEIRT